MRLPPTAPTLAELMATADLATVLPTIVDARVGSLVDGAYLHWEQVRHRRPPDGLDARSWWLGIKLSRAAAARRLPLWAANGVPFSHGLPDPVLEQLHWIDQHAAGEIVVTEAIHDPTDRRRYLVNSLFEEAITSSQLEGASSTRQVAKEMLRSGRSPRDRSERMIQNNYLAMSRLREMAQRPLTPDDVLELHRVLVDGTLADPGAAGRIQDPGDQRVVVVAPDGTVAHVPPEASELPDRLAAMCRFANGDGGGEFIHPVNRAILLHLWLAYDHPFEDGNGRTARALFYRQMLAAGYWLFEYVTISRLLLRAPTRYARAFLHTETDEFDATYFLVHQLQVIRTAIDDLTTYLRHKMVEARETQALLRRSDLNHRQLALLTHAIRHPEAVYTIRSHATSHRVVLQSARTDLLELERREYLERRRAGRRFEFTPVPDLRYRIEVGRGGA